jgi:hypothetical protein
VKFYKAILIVTSEKKKECMLHYSTSLVLTLSVTQRLTIIVWLNNIKKRWILLVENKGGLKLIFVFY